MARWGAGGPTRAQGSRTANLLSRVIWSYISGYRTSHSVRLRAEQLSAVTLDRYSDWIVKHRGQVSLRVLQDGHRILLNTGVLTAIRRTLVNVTFAYDDLRGHWTAESPRVAKYRHYILQPLTSFEGLHDRAAVSHCSSFQPHLDWKGDPHAPGADTSRA